jgi:hypothetical protein
VVATRAERQRPSASYCAGNVAGGRLSTGVAIALGAVIGLVLGILVSVTTEVPLAPEVGLVFGALAGWLLSQGSA